VRWIIRRLVAGGWDGDLLDSPIPHALEQHLALHHPGTCLDEWAVTRRQREPGLQRSIDDGPRGDLGQPTH
jgi:hypothetical protein